MIRLKGDDKGDDKGNDKGNDEGACTEPHSKRHVTKTLYGRRSTGLALQVWLKPFHVFLHASLVFPAQEP